MIIKHQRTELYNIGQNQYIDLKSLIQNFGTIRINIDENTHLICNILVDHIIIRVKNKYNNNVAHFEPYEWIIQGGYKREDIKTIIKLIKESKYNELLYIYNIQML